MESTATRRPCFLEENNGLASIASAEGGLFSETHQHHNHLLSRPLYYSALPRKSSLRNLSFGSVSSPRSSGRFFDGRFEETQPHFLDACVLCKKPLDNRDIFMYRGDTPFCSEECRSEQIDRDEAKEKNRNLSASMKAMRKKEQKEKSSTSPNKATRNYPFHAGTVAAA